SSAWARPSLPRMGRFPWPRVEPVVRWARGGVELREFVVTKPMMPFRNHLVPGKLSFVPGDRSEPLPLGVVRVFFEVVGVCRCSVMTQSHVAYVVNVHFLLWCRSTPERNRDRPA